MKTALLFAVATLAWGQSPVSVEKRPAPDKALIFEVAVPAPRAAVWHAFSTSESLSAWLSVQATVDLRNGGEWTVHFPGGSTGGGTIVSFVPQQELTIAALAPDQFPTVRAERTQAKFEFTGNGRTTVVRLTQTGWKRGDEWDKAYEYLAEGNKQLLESLYQHFANTAK